MKKGISNALTLIVMIAVVGGGMYLWQRGNSDSVYFLSEKIDGYEKEIENLKLQIASRESEETEESSDDAVRGDKYSLELKLQSDGSYKVTRTELLETMYWPGRD